MRLGSIGTRMPTRAEAGPGRAAALPQHRTPHARRRQLIRPFLLVCLLRCSPPARTGFVTVVLHGRIDPLVPLAHGEALHVRAARQHSLRQP